MDIVRAVGMSAGTFYNYFPDKHVLFEEITRESFNIMRDEMRELRRSLDIRDRKQRIRKIYDSCSAYFDFVDANPQQVLLVLRNSFGVDEEFDLDAWDYYSACAQDLAEDIDRWRLAGAIRGAAPVLIAHAVVGMAMQIAHAYLAEKSFTRNEAIDALVTMIVAIFETYITE